MRIGVVGLGSIAQKAWLPVLGAAESWTLQAAWSPGKRRRYGFAKPGGCHTLIPSMPWRHSAMRSLSIPRRLHIMK